MLEARSTKRALRLKLIPARYLWQPIELAAGRGREGGEGKGRYLALATRVRALSTVGHGHVYRAAVQYIYIYTYVCAHVYREDRETSRNINHGAVEDGEA